MMLEVLVLLVGEAFSLRRVSTIFICDGEARFAAGAKDVGGGR